MDWVPPKKEVTFTELVDSLIGYTIVYTYRVPFLRKTHVARVLSRRNKYTVTINQKTPAPRRVRGKKAETDKLLPKISILGVEVHAIGDVFFKEAFDVSLDEWPMWALWLRFGWKIESLARQGGFSPIESKLVNSNKRLTRTIDRLYVQIVTRNQPIREVYKNDLIFVLHNTRPFFGGHIIPSKSLYMRRDCLGKFMLDKKDKMIYSILR